MVDSLQYSVTVRKMCLLHCWTLILVSSLLWWPRWSVNRTYRSAGKCVRTNTASITVTESKCRRKWCGGEDQSCRLAPKKGWGNLAMPVVFGMFVSQLQRAFPVEGVTPSWLRIQTLLSYYLSVCQKLLPKYSN